VELVEVMGKTLAPFGLGRFSLDEALQGVSVRDEIAAAMGLLLHEMATNAVKYGALSSAKGKVVVTRAPASTNNADFEWREEGGPPVEPTSREGFGTRLMQQVLRSQGGSVRFEFEPQGFRAWVACPAAP